MPTKKSILKKPSLKKAVSSTKKNVKGIRTTIKEVRKSLATIQKSSQLKKRKSYSVRNLPIKKQANFAAYLKEIETNAKKIDKLRKPGEFWAAKFFGAKTYKTFSNISQLLNQLNQYVVDGEKYFKGHTPLYLTKGGKHLKSLIENVIFLKVDKKQRKTWYRDKQSEIQERKAKKVLEQGKEKRAKAAEKKAAKAERELKKQKAKAKEQQKKQQQKIKKLQQQLKKAGKKAVKKSVKKTATKKTVKKVTKKKRR